jgi:predicted ATPase/DNA-binding SARP family transcriptional activator/peroxiredoxin
MLRTEGAAPRLTPVPPRDVVRLHRVGALMNLPMSGDLEGSVMEFRVLGPFEVLEDGRSVDLGGLKRRALLAILVLEANRVVSVDRLFDALWPEEPPRTAAKSLQVHVARLRKVLGRDRISTQAGGYRLNVDEGELDLDRARRLAGERRFSEALSLWRGHALVDFAHEQFAQAEIARLEELRLVCLEGQFEEGLGLGRHLDLIGELEALVAAHPLRERIRAQLMLALYRSGRQADALDEYQSARRLFVEELGIEPSEELQRLQSAILNHDPSVAFAPAPRSEWNARLPSAPNLLIGRTTELGALGALLLGSARLVTLTGAGGSGKTRLALELATTLEPAFEGRVAFISLDALRQPDALAAAIVSALGLETTAGESPLQVLTSTLLDRPTLLVLDNFEHLSEAAPLLADLLADCGQLKLLVTSRGSLRISGEREFPLDPLPLQEASALLRDRIRAVRPSFSGDDPALAGICELLDRLPLALELAAPHMRLLSPEQLRARLDHRLEVLTGGPRDLASRQQTLRATIDWSYQLLDHEERQLFVRLAVFTGGCTLDAAERVCDATLGRLESLVDKNLIRRDEVDGEIRFGMLETIREYALEMLDAEQAVEGACQAYADYYLALAAEQVADVDRGHLNALHELERELDNFLAAFAWSHSPESVPTPIDDGAADHLPGRTIPPIVLDSSHGSINLAELADDRLVLYVYPGTTRPGRPPLPGLYAIPGGRGCTSESRSFRDHIAELSALGAHVAGVSVQTLDDQLEFARRAELPFPLIADPQRQLETILELPTFEVAGRVLYRRVTLIAERGVITEVFYPVFPPDRSAEQVIAALAELHEQDGQHRPPSSTAAATQTRN